MQIDKTLKKEEAIRQINDIKAHLIDKQTFFPYNYRATYVWSLISIILIFTTVPLYESNILKGTIVVSFLILVGFVTEMILTKKVNESYNIQECTLRQQFIMKSFLMVALFLIVFSAVLASYKLYVPIFFSWLFLISLVYYTVGFVLNIGRFTQMATFNMFASILLLAIGFINDALVGKTYDYLYVIQIFMVIGLAIMPAVVAWWQLKEGK